MAHKDLAAAVRRQIPQTNTSVIATDDGKVIVNLHDNVIAEMDGGSWRTTLAGWPTRLTMRRLNALQFFTGNVYSTVNHVTHCNGTPVNCLTWQKQSF